MEPTIRAKRWAAQTAQDNILGAFRAGDYNPRLEAARLSQAPEFPPRKREKPRQRHKSCRECLAIATACIKCNMEKFMACMENMKAGEFTACRECRAETCKTCGQLPIKTRRG